MNAALLYQPIASPIKHDEGVCEHYEYYEQHDDQDGQCPAESD